MTRVGSEKTFMQSELDQSAPAIVQDFNQQSITNKTMFRKKPKKDKIAWHYRQCVDHFGIGVIFSAASVFVYQGLITLTASFLGQFLVPDVVSQMSAIGGLLIFAIGIGLLEIKKIMVGNILPAIFIPLIYQALKHFSDVL